MRIVIAIILAALTAIGIASIILGGGVFVPLVGAIVAGLAVTYTIFSLGTVGLGEVAALTRLGKPIANLPKGLYFAPWGLYRVQKELKTLFQDELPSDPENIYRGDDVAPAGKFPPIRQKFGPPNPLDTDLVNDPYNVEMVAEVVPVVAWRITDALVFFDVVGTVANCRKMMADKAIKPITEDLAGMTPAKALKMLNSLNQRVKNELVTETTGWGIELRDGYIKQFNFSHGLNTSVEGVSIAGQNAKAVGLTADGEQQRLLKTGLATKNSDGTITLVPDAKTKAQTDALKKLSKLKGTLVLGNASTVLDVNKPNKGEDE